MKCKTTDSVADGADGGNAPIDFHLQKIVSFVEWLLNYPLPLSSRTASSWHEIYHFLFQYQVKISESFWLTFSFFLLRPFITHCGLSFCYVCRRFNFLFLQFSIILPLFFLLFLMERFRCCPLIFLKAWKGKNRQTHWNNFFKKYLKFTNPNYSIRVQLLKQ